jgi:hypothetical protein
MKISPGEKPDSRYPSVMRQVAIYLEIKRLRGGRKISQKKLKILKKKRRKSQKKRNKYGCPREMRPLATNQKMEVTMNFSIAKMRMVRKSSLTAKRMTN